MAEQSTEAPEAPRGGRLRWLIALVALTALAFGAAAALVSLRTADLRPEDVLDGVDEAEELAGRALLARVEASYGGARRWSEAGFALFEMEHDWAALPVGLLRGSEPDVSALRLRVMVDSDRPMMSVLGGEGAGEEWGIAEEGVFRLLEGGQVVWANGEGAGEGMRDLLADANRWFQLPFRADEADVVAALEPAEIDGVRYDRVYVSESASLDRAANQYILHVDPQTGLLRYVTATARHLGAGLVVSVEAPEHVEVSGVLVPTRQVTRLFAAPGTVTLREVRYRAGCFGAGCAPAPLAPAPASPASGGP
jgi:hypothetical protein